MTKTLALAVTLVLATPLAALACPGASKVSTSAETPPTTVQVPQPSTAEVQ